MNAEDSTGGMPPSGNPLPAVLAIAGSDPGGGAGLEADLKTLTRHGVHAMAVPTLLTVQNTTGIKEVRHLDPDFLERQFDFLLEDIRPSVIKIGAIGSRDMLLALIRMLSVPELRDIPIVSDTIVYSTSGAELFELRGLADFRDRFLPLTTLITPNVPEFEILYEKPVTKENAEDALRGYGMGKSYSILLKGGHFPGEPVDFLLHDHAFHAFPQGRVDTPHTHGSGCAMASAVAAQLALGKELRQAVREAQAYVRRAITENPGLGRGRGPLNFAVPPR